MNYLSILIRSVLMIFVPVMCSPCFAQRSKPSKVALIDDRTGKSFMLRSDQEVRLVYDAPHDVEWHECNAFMIGQLTGLDARHLQFLYTEKELSCQWRDSMIKVMHHPHGYAPANATIPVGDVRFIIKHRWGHEAASYAMIAGLTLALVIAPMASFGYQGNWHDFNADTYKSAAAAGLIVTGVALPFYLAIPSQRELRLR